MTGIDRDPRVDEWFNGTELGRDGILGTIDQLTALKLVADGPEPADFTDEVMRSWHRMLIASAHVRVRSEQAFIHQARRKGWPWERIAAVLALPDAAAAEARLAALEPELARTHPSTNQTPWTGP